jgi:hypothetical protein
MRQKVVGEIRCSRCNWHSQCPGSAGINVWRVGDEFLQQVVDAGSVMGELIPIAAPERLPLLGSQYLVQFL